MLDRFSKLLASQYEKHKLLLFLVYGLALLYIWVPMLLMENNMRRPEPVMLVVNDAIGIVGAYFFSICALRYIKSTPLFIFIVFNALLLLVGDFSAFYWLIGTSHNWSVPLTHLDSVYVAVGTLTTAGTSGISATSETAKAYLLLQNVIDFTVLSTLVATVVYRLNDRKKLKNSVC